MKNLLKDDCSESEGSSSEGNGSTSNEGRGTSEDLRSASRAALLGVDVHTGPGGGFLSGEASEGGVDLGADLLGLEPGGSGGGGVGQLPGGDTTGGARHATTGGGGGSAGAVTTGVGEVPLGGGDSGDAGNGDSGAEVLVGGVAGDHLVEVALGGSGGALGVLGLAVVADDGVGGSDSEASTDVLVDGNATTSGTAH